MSGNRTSWTPEVDLLLRCATPRPIEGARSDLLRGITHTIDWSSLVELATWHRLTGFLAHRLDPATVPVPATVLDTLGREHGRLVERRRRDRWELRKALMALDSSAIPVVLLKGAALVETVYADAPELRPMADLDLLVREADLDRAEAVIRSLGYASPDPPSSQDALRRHHRHYPPLFNRDGTTCFELHRHIARRGSVLTFDIEAFWRRSQPIEIDGARARLLAPEDQAIHLLLHLFQDARQASPSRGALGKLVDLATVVGHPGWSFDWAALADRTRALGLTGPVACGLLAARALVDLDVPASCVEALSHPGLGDLPIDAYIHRKLLAPPGDVWSFHELVEPPDRWSLANELKSATRRIVRGPRDLSRRYRPWLDRQRDHQWWLRTMVSTLRAPRRALDHRRVDRWMVRLMARPRRGGGLGSPTR